MAVCAGFPAAVNGLFAAKELFAELDRREQAAAGAPPERELPGPGCP